MSVVIGETPKQESRDSALVAHDSTELAAEWPLSITAWIYFDQAPGQGQTQTILWYGEQSSSQRVVLEAAVGATSGIDVTARLFGSTGSVSAVAEQLPIGEWVMLTVIIAEGQGGLHVVTLYVNDTEADTDSAAIGTTAPGDYDHFVLGADSAGSNFGRFRAEHVAIWEPVGDPTPEPLSASEIEELFEERWVPITPVEIYPINRNPEIAYWMLVGHWAAGIEAANNQGTGAGAPDSGQLFNQANPDGQTAKPPLQMLDTSKPVIWSAKTPVMRYKTPEQDMAPGPIVHPQMPPVSRLQPHFYVFNTASNSSGPLGTFKYGPLATPPYTHPNFITIGIASAESAQSIVSPFAKTAYFPNTDGGDRGRVRESAPGDVVLALSKGERR
jgi:hypothetical protein